VVREFVGHGVGLSLHEEPQVKNYVEMKDFLPGFRTVLKPGTVLVMTAVRLRPWPSIWVLVKKMVLLLVLRLAAWVLQLG